MKNISDRKKIIYFLVLLFEIVFIFCVTSGLEEKMKSKTGEAYHQSFSVSELKSNYGSFENDGYYVDETIHPKVHPEGDVFTFGPYASLYPGEYLVTLHYKADSGQNLVRTYSNKNAELNFEAENTYTLPTDQTEVTFPVSISKTTDDFEIQTIYMGEGSFSVHSLEITSDGIIKGNNPYAALIKCLSLIAIFVFLDILILYFCRNRTHLHSIVLLALVTFILSAPLYVPNVISGHDIAFHLGRIYGIRDGLLNGNFYIKLQSNWIHDYGYLVGVFYGDLFLYIPAVLNILGMPMMSAYKVFMALMTFGTALITYFCLNDMYKEQKISLLGSILYTAGIYRLLDLYLRHSVGETLAMMFLPLIICGINRIYRKEGGNHNGWLILSAGLFGMINSHVLSCEMVIIFMLLFFLINIKSTLQKNVFKQLCLSAGVTLLAGLGFIVPFLDFYVKGGLNVMNAERNAFSLNDRGIMITQLLEFFVPADGINQDIHMGPSDEMPLTIGFALICGLAVAFFTLYFVWKNKSGNVKKICFYVGFGALSIYMATYYFPWDSIREIPFLENAISSIQFPWRFLGPATVFAVFAFCESLMILKDTKYRPYLMNLCGVIILIAAISAMYFISGTNRRNDYIEFHSAKELNLVNTGDEYLPIDTNVEQLNGNTRIDGDMTVVSYSKKGTSITAEIVAKEDSVFEVPLIYYKYYRAKIDDVNLEVYGGQNNVVAIKIPAGMNGTLHLDYVMPVHWYLSCFISIATVLWLLGYWMYDKFLVKKKENNS